MNKNVLLSHKFINLEAVIIMKLFKIQSAIVKEW